MASLSDAEKLHYVLTVLKPTKFEKPKYQSIAGDLEKGDRYTA